MESNKYKDMLEHIINACNNYYKIDDKTDKDLFLISTSDKENKLELTLSRYQDNDYKSIYSVVIEGDDSNTRSEIAYFKCLKDTFTYYVK